MTVEAPDALRQKHYNATVSRLKKVHEDLMIMRVRPDFPLPKHLPGQYSTLGLGNWEQRHPGAQEEIRKPDEAPKLIRRAYSISCPILDDDGALLDLAKTDWLEFYIVLVREAEKAPPALTPRIFLLDEGERIFLGEKIAGHFTLETVQPGDTVVFLSTGTGEAPHNYMLWELLAKGHTGKLLSACCVRYRRDLGYIDTHDELMRRYPHYQYLALTTREAVNAGQKVYIQDLITSGQLEEKLGQALDPAHTHVYLCGNPKMIGVPEHDRATGEYVYPKPLGIIEILEKRGFRRDQPALKLKGNIHFEEYW
jgi:ferredoxin--NADP+ reductase